MYTHVFMHSCTHAHPHIHTYIHTPDCKNQGCCYLKIIGSRIYKSEFPPFMVMFSGVTVNQSSLVLAMAHGRGEKKRKSLETLGHGLSFNPSLYSLAFLVLLNGSCLKYLLLSHWRHRQIFRLCLRPHHLYRSTESIVLYQERSIGSQYELRTQCALFDLCKRPVCQPPTSFPLLYHQPCGSLWTRLSLDLELTSSFSEQAVSCVKRTNIKARLIAVYFHFNW